ncbi:large terminase [Novosphingobium marinum]|uniref:Putative phage terminase large subunit-like protein n=1 Tax=Novosphingobium marinum TaxID=1514948 RepID=A0A7Y9XW75_9SPHN|nr:terminase family protein [Novosphingobium marinum]NYH94530.1 putative phage terminase large subunit-like protein [Novosphingobium marinum]GGC23042.1 large terminase [Novosphingobium marinum]
MAGRGWGKTRTGAEDVAWFGAQHAGSRIAIIAPTFADARDTCVEGESGLLAVLPKVCVDHWNRSHGELVLWNETRYKLFSATEPERLRGPQHHRAWGDEVGAWPDPSAWDQMLFGLRLGRHPQVVATTTPRPTPLIRKIVRTPGAMVTRGSTFDNSANLPEGTLAHLKDRYEGTRLGRQELYAELLEDVPGALWTAEMIDAQRLRAAPELRRVVVAVDPSGTKGDGQGDDIGIVVAGKGTDDRFYVLEDASCQLSPDGWARRVAGAFERWQGDRVVAERNFGGAMVEAVLRTAAKNLPVRMVTASRGKIARAEPVAALYEQGKVSHCGEFTALEDQLCAMTGGGYVGEGSPDRADALVWALSDLSGSKYRYSLAEVL